MKKLFISQPMSNKTEEEILAEREEAIRAAKELLGEDVEVIDSYTEMRLTPLGYLGYSIMRLAEADIAYFAKGWQDARGCKIEYECALKYGIKTITAEFDANKTVVGRRLNAGFYD